MPMHRDSFTIYKACCVYAAPLNSIGAAHAGGASAAIPVQHPLLVIKAEGWVCNGIDGEAQKLKPGLVSTTPEPLLWMDLPLEELNGRLLQMLRQRSAHHSAS